MERAKVGQSLPLRGVPVSGWVSNTLRGLIVRLKSSLFLVQVYGTANETLLIIPESSYSYLRFTRITSGYPVGVLSVSLILQKMKVASVEKSHTVCVIKRVSLQLEPKMVKTETKANDNAESGVTYSSKLRGQIHPLLLF